MTLRASLILTLATVSGCSGELDQQALGAADSRPSETGVVDSGDDATSTMSGCVRDDDCPNGQHCIWWAAGCGPDTERGVCGVRTGLDACGACNDYCDCDGVTRNGWATGPWSHHGPCSTLDANGPAPDAG